MLDRFCFILLFCAVQASADSLSDLKVRLEGLQSQDPVKASVEHQIWRRNGDEKHPVITQGKASAWVEDGAQGIKIFWSRNQLQQAAQESQNQAQNPEKTAPTRMAMESLTALDLVDSLNSASRLIRNLDQAQLVDERDDNLDGKPARMITCKLNPRFSEQDKKYIKEFEATAKIWLGEDGFPIAAETKSKVRGRAMLVINFQSEDSETFRFIRLGKRLITLNHIRESRSSGGGESGQSKDITAIALTQD